MRSEKVATDDFIHKYRSQQAPHYSILHDIYVLREFFINLPLDTLWGRSKNRLSLAYSVAPRELESEEISKAEKASADKDLGNAWSHRQAPSSALHHVWQPIEASQSLHEIGKALPRMGAGPELSGRSLVANVVPVNGSGSATAGDARQRGTCRGGLLEGKLCTDGSTRKERKGKPEGAKHEEKQGQGDVMIPLSPWLRNLKKALELVDLIPPHPYVDHAWKKAREAVISMIEQGQWLLSHRHYEFLDCGSARGRDDVGVDSESASPPRPRANPAQTNGKKVLRGRPRKPLKERIAEPVLAADLVPEVFEGLTGVALSIAGCRRPLEAAPVPQGKTGALALSQSKRGCGQGGLVIGTSVSGLWDVPAVNGFNGRYQVNFGFPAKLGSLDPAFPAPSILHDI